MDFLSRLKNGGHIMKKEDFKEITKEDFEKYLKLYKNRGRCKDIGIACAECLFKSIVYCTCNSYGHIKQNAKEFLQMCIDEKLLPIVIHTDTEEKFMHISTLFDYGDNIGVWEKLNGEKTCVNINYNRWCNIGYYTENAYIILSYEDYIDIMDITDSTTETNGEETEENKDHILDYNEPKELKQTINLLEKTENTKENWTDKHYNFDYTLTEQDVKLGKIKIDPYFVSNIWKLGEKDNSGILFHNLKTIARFGDKNSIEREIKALYNQVKRLAELNNIDLE